MPRPIQGEFPEYTRRYIELVKGKSVNEIIDNHEDEILSFYQNLPEHKAAFSYAPGKWNVKELLQHVIDTERIFTYRALCIARKDTTPLPGFDEEVYAIHSLANNRTLSALKEEFIAVHKASLALIQSFNNDQFAQIGLTNNSSITVNTIVFVIYGHLLHHKKILLDKYLI